MTQCPAILLFSIAQFRALFPAYSNEGCFPDAMLNGYWARAITIVSNKNYGWLRGAYRQEALNLMTAHLLALSAIIGEGGTPGVVTGATIDKISITLEPPPYQTQFQYWLGTTPYGQELLALLAVWSTGGFWTAGSLGRRGFGP